jgi:hypothetical protein
VNVGNGVSELFFQPTAAQRSGKDLLYVGNLKPHKNPGPVFAALRRVRDARLTVVTSDVAGVHALSRTHGVEDRVRTVASCTDQQLRDLYASSTALLTPSLREGFGLPAVEALAVGTPVIHWRGWPGPTPSRPPCAGTSGRGGRTGGRSGGRGTAWRGGSIVLCERSPSAERPLRGRPLTGSVEPAVSCPLEQGWPAQSTDRPRETIISSTFRTGHSAPPSLVRAGGAGCA